MEAVPTRTALPEAGEVAWMDPWELLVEAELPEEVVEAIQGGLEFSHSQLQPGTNPRLRPTLLRPLPIRIFRRINITTPNMLNSSRSNSNSTRLRGLHGSNNSLKMIGTRMTAFEMK